VVQGQHPCIESTYDNEGFVPDDLSLGGLEERVMLLSGPNMVSSCVLAMVTLLRVSLLILTFFHSIVHCCRVARALYFEKLVCS